MVKKKAPGDHGGEYSRQSDTKKERGKKKKNGLQMTWEM